MRDRGRRERREGGRERGVSTQAIITDYTTQLRQMPTTDTQSFVSKKLTPLSNTHNAFKKKPYLFSYDRRERNLFVPTPAAPN